MREREGRMRPSLFCWNNTKKNTHNPAVDKDPQDVDKPESENTLSGRIF